MIASNKNDRSFPKDGCSIVIESDHWPAVANFQVKKGSVVNGVWTELEGRDFSEAVYTLRLYQFQIQSC